MYLSGRISTNLTDAWMTVAAFILCLISRYHFLCRNPRTCFCMMTAAERSLLSLRSNTRALHTSERDKERAINAVTSYMNSSENEVVTGE